MTTALETIALQLQELQDLRAQSTRLARWDSELQEREAAVAQAAEQPWGELAVVRAEQLGVTKGLNQSLALIDQQLAWLQPHGAPAVVLKTLREQILKLV